MNERIANELKEAMKSGDKFKLSVLRMLKSALQLEKINQREDLTDDKIMAVIKKQVKIRKDSMEEFKKYNKSEYLPEEMSEEEINKVIDEVFDIIKPTSMKDMGKVMKELNTKITNADMSLVSKLVKERIN